MENSNNKKLADYQFGFADAEKEYTRVPGIFESAFYDYRGTVKKLTDEHYFLLIGRKGVGKSAVRAKIQSLADRNNNVHAVPLQLNDFEFTTFAKTNSDKDLTGTQKYKESWDFVLQLMCFKVANRDLSITENEDMNKMLILLSKLGFDPELNYKKDVVRLSKLKIGNSIASFDIEFEKEFGTKPASFLERVSTVNEKMLSVLSKIWFGDEQVIILIDGVDDILRIKKNQLEILSSLIRSANYLNDKFFEYKIPIKIVLFLREDIVSNVTDPDLNKIKRDGAISLNWSSSLDDLKKVVNLRFQYSGISEVDAIGHWGEIFPKKIQNKDSWVYILDHTLYKPRDILQLLKSAQEIYPNNYSLTFSEVRTVLKDYSKSYFIEEMKNEIAGFVKDEYINILPSVLQKIGERSFTFEEFKDLMEEQGVNNSNNNSEVRYLLLLLFNAGYIGQLIKNTRHSKISVTFKYRNEHSQIDYKERFIIHKGLYNGLGISGI